MSHVCLCRALGVPLRMSHVASSVFLRARICACLRVDVTTHGFVTGPERIKLLVELGMTVWSGNDDDMHYCRCTHDPNYVTLSGKFYSNDSCGCRLTGGGGVHSCGPKAFNSNASD